MNLQLKVKNKKYSGWENVRIAKSMESLAHDFSMDIFKGDQVEIEDDDLVEILVDDEVFFTGYADIITLGISDKKKPLNITGRSKAGDLIDCNISINKQYNKQNIVQIINDLIKPFNIAVTSSLSLSPLEVFNTKVGETYFDAINRLCKQTNTLPISKNNGDIEIVKNQNNKTSTVLKDGDFKEIFYPKNLVQRFSSYTYKKESILTDVTDSIIKDDTVKRYRPFVGINTDDKSNSDLANWEKNRNKANETNITAVVKDWNLDINTIVKLETEIINNSFLIKDLVFEKGDNGTITNITFVSKDFYNVK